MQRYVDALVASKENISYDEFCDYAIRKFYDFCDYEDYEELNGTDYHDVSNRTCDIEIVELFVYGLLDETNDIETIENFLIENGVSSDDYEIVDGEMPMMNNRAFLTCLMKAKNTNKYVDYYLSLSNIHEHYYRYQLRLIANKE